MKPPVFNYEDYEKLLAENDELCAANERLDKECDSLRSQRSRLEAEVKRLRDHAETIRQDYLAMAHKSIEREKTLAKLEAEVNVIKRDFMKGASR